MSKAVLLLSGGLDSVVSLAFVRDKFSEVLALTFNYGQKSFEFENYFSKKIVDFYSIQHKIVDLNWLSEISNSSLTSNKDVPFVNIQDLNALNHFSESSIAVCVPNRNALFINIAACFADSLGFDSIIIGANNEEANTFKDNSKEFIYAVQNSLLESTSYNIKLSAPLIDMTKEQIVKLAIDLNVPFEYIYSCYLGTEKHCGKCESCQRLKRALQLNDRIDIIERIF